VAASAPSSTSIVIDGRPGGRRPGAPPQRPMDVLLSGWTGFQYSQRHIVATQTASPASSDRSDYPADTSFARCSMKSRRQSHRSRTFPVRETALMNLPHVGRGRRRRRPTSFGRDEHPLGRPAFASIRRETNSFHASGRRGSSAAGPRSASGRPAGGGLVVVRSPARVVRNGHSALGAGPATARPSGITFDSQRRACRPIRTWDFRLMRYRTFIRGD